MEPVIAENASGATVRGDNTFVFDMRSTKFIALCGERRLGLFAEFFNPFNTELRQQLQRPRQELRIPTGFGIWWTVQQG